MLCPDPVFQYKLFMLINSAAYALIPLSAFRLTEKLGVTKLWQRLLVTALCGIFPSVLIIFRGEKENGKKAGAFFASVTAGILTACAYFLSPSCAGVFLAVCLYCLYVKLTGVKKSIYFSTYAITFILLFAADIILTWLTKDLYAYSGGILQSVTGSLQTLSENSAALLTLIGVQR